MEEIIGAVPSRIVRVGIGAIAAMGLGLGAGSWLVRYPDVLTAPIVVTTRNPPAKIVARADGRIRALYVADRASVQAGERIALIDNPADERDVAALRERLGRLAAGGDSLDPALFPEREEPVLGELQSDYAGFVRQYRECVFLRERAYPKRKADMLRRQIRERGELLKPLAARLASATEEADLAGRRAERTQALRAQGFASDQEYETDRAALVGKRSFLSDAESALQGERLRILELEQSISDLELQRTDEERKARLALDQLREALEGKILQWDRTYLVRSPLAGVAALTRIWSPQQNVRTGEVVVSIVPRDAGPLFGTVLLPAAASGKVRAGQRVLVKLDGFPHEEYGSVAGLVLSKSIVPADAAYVIQVGFADGLRTSYGRTLEFSQELSGVAEIVTEDLRLPERLLQPIRALLQAR